MVYAATPVTTCMVYNTDINNELVKAIGWSVRKIDSK